MCHRIHISAIYVHQGLDRKYIPTGGRPIGRAAHTVGMNRWLAYSPMMVSKTISVNIRYNQSTLIFPDEVFLQSA